MAARSRPRKNRQSGITVVLSQVMAMRVLMMGAPGKNKRGDINGAYPGRLLPMAKMMPRAANAAQGYRRTWTWRRAGPGEAAAELVFGHEDDAGDEDGDGEVGQADEKEGRAGRQFSGPGSFAGHDR